MADFENNPSDILNAARGANSNSKELGPSIFDSLTLYPCHLIHAAGGDAENGV